MKKKKFDFEFCMKQKSCASCKNRRACDESENKRKEVNNNWQKSMKMD